MAAEDYIDFDDNWESSRDGAFTSKLEQSIKQRLACQLRTEQRLAQQRLAQQRNTGENLGPMKNKDIEWVTGQGEVLKLKEMEDSHLLNTIAYVTRKIDSHGITTMLAAERGFTLPALVVNRQPAQFWIDAMLKELNRREVKRAKALA